MRAREPGKALVTRLGEAGEGAEWEREMERERRKWRSFCIHTVCSSSRHPGGDNPENPY